MQRSSSSATVDQSFPMVRVDRGDRPTASTESNPADPSEIYRRLDRRPKGRPMWMTAVAIALLAVVAVGGVIAYQQALRPPASHTQFLTPGSVRPG